MTTEQTEAPAFDTKLNLFDVTTQISRLRTVCVSTDANCPGVGSDLGWLERMAMGAPASKRAAIVVFVIALSCLPTTGCGSTRTSSAATQTPTISTSLPASASSSPVSPSVESVPPKDDQPDPNAPAVKCERRSTKAGEILVRFVTPDEPPYTTRLGSHGVWDHGDEVCLTSMEFALKTDPGLPGVCTQVAYVRDNPGYNEDRVPSARLKHLRGQAGDC